MRRLIFPMAAFDYLKTRTRLWLKVLIALIPSLGVFFVMHYATPKIANTTLTDVFANFVNVQISSIAILISFSIAIITILISADNANIRRLKTTDSTDCKPLDGNPLSLFQVLLSNIAYNVLAEVLYLSILITMVFARLYVSEDVDKILMAICVFFLVHVLYVLLETVGQMYLAFWK